MWEKGTSCLVPGLRGNGFSFSPLSMMLAVELLSVSSVAQSCPYLCDTMYCSMPSGVYANSCPLNQWCRPTISSSVVPFSSCLQSFPASSYSPRSLLFTSGGQNWNFHFNISPSNGYSGLISFRMDWLDLLVVQRTVKSLLQHHSSKASILRHSAFFIVQLSHPYMTTGKTIALTRQTSVGKVMSLLFDMLSRLVITFLPRSKRLLISWLQSPSAVILEPKKVKSATVSTVSPSICHEMMGPDAMILVFWMLSFKPTFSLSRTGEGNGNPIQCSCLENPRDGGVWWAAFSGVAQSRTRLKRLSSSSSRVILDTEDKPK